MKHVFNCMGHEVRVPDIVDSRGIYVIDAAGKHYMDLESGVWCLGLGHKDDRITRAITAQMDRLMHAGYAYSAAVVDEAAALLLDVAGLPGGQCVFLCSGSEAIEVARQIARHLTGKPLSMTLHDSYLGAYSSVTDRSHGWFLFDWTVCSGCPLQATCDPACPLLTGVPPTISDFVFEPGSSSGFVRFPPRAMIQNLVSRVRAQGGRVIANEVTTGTGRTGRWFGFQHYDIEVDMVAVGKGIGNGYPVSATVIGATTIAGLVERPFKYGQSHMNDPLGAAVVREVIQAIRAGDLVTAAAEKGRRCLAQLESLVTPDRLPAARGRGLMLAVDVAGQARAARLYDALIARGFLVSNRRTAFRIDPPFIIEPAEFDRFITAFEAALVADGHGA